MPRPEWRDPAKERYWRRMLGRWRRSGLTGRDFCAQNALSEPSFYAWKREIAQRDQEEKTPVHTTTRASVARRAAATLPAFLPVTVDSAGVADALEVVTAAGRVLRVRAGFDADALRQLLAVLEERPC